jgi:hypothetical protein
VGYLRCRHCGKRVPAAGRLCPACGAELHRSWRRILLAAVALLLLVGGYYVVAEVITVRRIQGQLVRVSRASLASLLPAPTPTYTPIPTPTTEWKPTPTRIPTATPVLSPTPTATATGTATTTPSPTARPPTATPVYPYAAITLLEPAAGAELASDAVTLSWKSVGELAEDEWYGLSLRYWRGGQIERKEARVKETSWQVPPELRGIPDPARPSFEWDVRLVRRTVVADGSTKDVALSPAGETRAFAWR